MISTHPGSRRMLGYSWRLLLMLSILCSGLVAVPAFAQQNVHVVGYGEYLSSIAVQYGVPMSELIAANGLSNPNVIVPGQRLVIPGAGGNAASYDTVATSAVAAGGGYYTVQRGDSLSSIAAAKGMSMYDLMRLNGIGNANFIWVGQQLRLSARVSTVSAPAEQQPAPQLAGTIYTVGPGDTLSQIAANYGTTAQALLIANGLPNANFVWVGQQLRISGAGSVAEVVQQAAAAAPVANYGGAKWIEVNLSTQTLTAWEGDVAVLSSIISSGVSATPTVTGRFQVYNKLTSQHMYGPGYSLPGVPSVMYFYGAYAIHGAYWHNNFGNPMSHGCVNMNLGDAAVLFNWAPMGTEVYVHY